MSDGWIKLHRKIIDNSIFKNPNLFRLAVYLVMRANHKDNKTFIGYEEILVKRGQTIIGERSMSRFLDVSPSTIRKQLKVLESKQFIERESKHRFSVITIVKYEDYQGEEHDKEAQKGAVKEAEQKRNKSVTKALTTPNNNDKNEKNDKKNNTSPDGSPVPVPTEKKKTIVDLYCLAFESHFKVKPFVRDDGKIAIPKGEVMALQRILRFFGEVKARGLFTPDESGHIPIFTDDRIKNDNWIQENVFSPNSLEKKLIKMKNKQNIEGASNAK